MRCPYCGHGEDRVLDTRPAAGARAIRRRRECLGCARRFTTYEEVEDLPMMVVKKDERRERFDRAKVLGGLKAACQKRPISTLMLESMADEIERTLYNQFHREVRAEQVGEMVMDRLLGLDPVAYVRFASVYRAFADPEQFRDLVDALSARAPTGEEAYTSSPTELAGEQELSDSHQVAGEQNPATADAAFETAAEGERPGDGIASPELEKPASPDDS